MNLWSRWREAIVEGLVRRLRRHPPGFPIAIDAWFEQTLVYEGSSRTGGDLFVPGAGQPLPPLVYRRFRFDRDGRAYVFDLRDDGRTLPFVPGERRAAHLDAAGDSVHMLGRVVRAFPVSDRDDDA